jgi:hypothetical protein
MSDISKEQRYEIVGLTKAEADRCMEVLCGGPMPWDRGYCFASSELFARPSRYGPEPSRVGATLALKARRVRDAAKKAEQI